VFTGSRGVEMKLVDSVGTFQDAVKKAKELGKLPADAPLYDENSSALDLIFGGMGSFFGKNPLGSVTGNNGLIEYRYVP
jgi:ClpP class serine protease